MTVKPSAPALKVHLEQAASEGGKGDELNPRELHLNGNEISQFRLKHKLTRGKDGTEACTRMWEFKRRELQ